MKAILLSAIAASMALSAAAAPKRLASILEVEPDMDLSDPISVAMYTSFFTTTKDDSFTSTKETTTPISLTTTWHQEN